MPSAIRMDEHCEPQGWMTLWLGTYATYTPGVQFGGNGTTKLDDDNDPEPNAMLRIRPEYGGQSSTDHRGYIDGPPELVVEIAGSTAKTDLQLKLEIYRRAGVREYLVWETLAEEFYWFILKDGDYYRVFPDEQGQLRSQMFPGLWLDVNALLKGDLAKVLSLVQMGIGTPDHSKFVERLEAQKVSSESSES